MMYINVEKLAGLAYKEITFYFKMYKLIGLSDR